MCDTQVRMGRPIKMSMTKEQQKIAAKYTPFRDPEPPNYVPVHPKPYSVRVYRKIRGGVIVEWRGQIPGGVGNFCPDEIIDELF